MAKRSFVVRFATELGKEIKKEKARQAREAAAAEKAYQRMQKAAEAERARAERQKARDEKAAALQRQRKEAEEQKLRLQQASLDDRYVIARERYSEIEKRLPELVDDDATIAYCKEAIQLVPLLYDYEKRKSLLQKRECIYPDASALYLRLSGAYESLGSYDRAILACRDAMEMGITSAGKQGSMEDRIAALTEKKNEVKSNG